MNALHGASARQIATDFAEIHSRRLRARPEEFYHRYLLAVRQLAGAVGATLLVEPRAEIQHRPLLIHEGDAEPVPELIDEDTALAAVAALAATDRPDIPAQQFTIRYYPSRHDSGCLLRIAVGMEPWLVGDSKPLPAAAERRHIGRGAFPEEMDESVWIGLHYGDSPAPPGLARLQDPGMGEPETAAEWLAHILVLGGARAWETCQLSAMLRDPTSQLPGRAEFQARLKNAFHIARNGGAPLGLLLINPDDFGVINQRLDSESGDRALAEVAQMLRDCLRRTDAVFRYGGAVFAALMPSADENAINAVADKIRQVMTGAYLDGAVRLSFSVGAAVYLAAGEEDDELDELGLLRRADHALNLAKRAGGGCSVLWNPDEPALPGAGQDRLSGIFTANAEKDYRNMLLLWDTITVISSGAEEEQIAADFVARIHMSLKPKRIGLITGDAESGLRFLASAERSAATGAPYLELSDEQRELLANVQREKAAERLEFSASDAGETLAYIAYAVPLLAGERYLGCLYIEGPRDSLTLDSSDRIFLNALASQVALALDRADLAARWKEETEREHRRLREEVQELRQVVTSARLVYRSREMQNLLDTLRSVAPTDVTILINGESGTGKEMLARSVHEMGSRKDKPLVTVDCGAIAHNLIEAELFGHVKGAYTGADGASAGRIALADGGTLFLDEIGEIPLDVQAKFLRFVQEKEINPVGATNSRHVDVRIIAATNRDLAAEVAAGRFREDLFYRLKVVTLTAPPLRERPADILPLAKHFLEKFALQYEKGIRRFSADAEQALQGYAWPGNVRELQNCVLRAVVLSAGEQIDPRLLPMDGEAGAPDARMPEARMPEARMPEARMPEARTPEARIPDARMPETGASPAPNPASPAPLEPGAAPHAIPTADSADTVRGEPWRDLREELARQVDGALADGVASPGPLGTWLAEDLLREADTQAQGVARRGAAQLGVAETTYRRQFEKIQRAQAQGLLARNAAWSALAPAISQLVASLAESGGENALERARDILLHEVCARTDGRDKLGAMLMGVTQPTYRRWVSKP